MPRNRSKARETYAGAKPLQYVNGKLSYLKGPLASPKVTARVPSQQPALFSKKHVKAMVKATQQAMADGAAA